MAAASFRWLLQLHKDVPRAARFYSEGLDFTVNVCTLRWAELQSASLKLALMQSPNDHIVQKGYSSMLSFTVTDINSTVAKLMALGAELDGPIKYEIHGKVAAMRCLDGHVLGLYEPV
ncbi:uncharacterized protein LOC110604882 isoform X2 [Manihot esculenta]|uniref:Glyoxalase/fosfomycin resistance/dioxygenase domain-containing protein n=1 Tax=Manihot esculenta TaxID=3983 RepID=A0A2C9WC86_MANES|nr:uncharacterized protein LOC110604882 isoform X2 [Manihot esculenta]OAY56412.1 hypothetical protein MANES_02G014100v8 [Manihot esculenta]